VNHCPAGIVTASARKRASLVRFAPRGISAAMLLASMAAAPAAAQIAVDRTEIIFRTSRGEPNVALINLHNEGKERVQAVVRLEDWDRSENGTNNWYPYATKPGSCDKVLSVFPLTVSLEPDAKQSIRVALDSTASLDHECWAGAIVETVQPHTIGGRNVAYVIRTATKVYVQPAAALPAHGEVMALRIQPPPAESAARDSSSELYLEFANTGGKHLKTPGEVQFRRPDNSVAATVTLPILYTLPGAKSATKVAVPKLAPGRYIVLAVLDYGGDELAAGQIEYEVKQ
jgi:P pilus assembly chaperone PapD